MGLVVGEVVTLGRHRLMCGDSGNPEHVAALMGDVRPDLVFTSPPYAQQRKYVSGIGDWDVLMQRVFGAMPHHEQTQVLVNLGLVHRNGEVWEYWQQWVQWMRGQSWRWFGWYCWDKGGAIPGNWNGRLPGCHEMLLHFNKTARTPNKTIPCKEAGREHFRKTMGNTLFGGTTTRNVGLPTGTHKPLDSVIRVPPHKVNTGHPAVFPVALPTEIIRAYTDPGEVVYEPFAGSGTTILAAEREGRTAFAMECEPTYCDIAVARFAKACAQPPLSGVA